ncbi:MAG: sigma 54-interacting transcriptional regulator [Acidobacteriota bacterium]
MSDLPRLLIIDDVYGRGSWARNRDREMFCARLGIRDVTGDVATAEVGQPVAEAILHSGQVQTDRRIDNDVDGVIELLRAGWQKWPRWAMVLLDMHFQTGPVDPLTGDAQGESTDRDPAHYFGLTILDRIRKEPDLAEIPVVILSAMEREHIESRFARHGVFAFVDKQQLDRKRLRDLLLENAYLVGEGIVGHSVPLLAALRSARRAARIGNANILVLGETGTGKELLATYIHRSSRRSGKFCKLFVHANEDMFSADLFGYVRGAFTGAARDRPGAAEMADGGTLFFDEFGDIPAGVQDRLMRLLDTGTREAQRIGDGSVRKLDLQVVMATNRFEMLERGFRSDLLQRANAANPVVLPPLRDRREDIPLLVEYLVRRHERRLAAERREISPEAMELMMSSPWPGNVRELEHAVLQAVSSYRGIRYLSPEHLPSVLPPTATSATRGRPAERAGNLPAGDRPVEVSAVGEGSVDGMGQERPEEVTEPGATLDDALAALGAVRFEIADKDRWLGRLGEVQAAYARFIACQLDAALAASAIASGEPKPTTAVRMLLGTRSMRTSDAASLVKRLLSISRESIADLLADDRRHLGNTLRWAENLRGSRGSARRGGRSGTAR